MLQTVVILVNTQKSDFNFSHKNAFLFYPIPHLVAIIVVFWLEVVQFDLLKL